MVGSVQFILKYDKNNRFVFISEAWKNMSQINENDVNIPSTRKQPSIIRILLNVDCLQPLETEEKEKTEIVLQILLTI